MEPAEVLQLLRRRSGLGLRALARRAGTSHATLHAYETGAVEPRVGTLRRVATAAGYDVELTLTRRPDRGAREARGQELAEVLELAAEFPARHHRSLRAPVFGRAPS
ncbi:MAG: helix-turn-helix transcriptional regulator [Acidimicrobiales bacterium]